MLVIDCTCIRTCILWTDVLCNKNMPTYCKICNSDFWKTTFLPTAKFILQTLIFILKKKKDSCLPNFMQGKIHRWKWTNEKTPYYLLNKSTDEVIWCDLNSWVHQCTYSPSQDVVSADRVKPELHPQVTPLVADVHVCSQPPLSVEQLATTKIIIPGLIIFHVCSVFIHSCHRNFVLLIYRCSYIILAKVIHLNL